MSRNSNNGRSNNTGRTELVSRERFLRAVEDIYRERERNAELQAALQRAYTDGAACCSSGQHRGLRDLPQGEKSEWI
ncbi:MAG: hypothetical protein EBU36_02670 [Verrucomicrobia bacterium]|nr:hypothetical protein [Verrucomicrobiota bacterium]